MKKTLSFIFPIYNEELFLEKQIKNFINAIEVKYKNKFEILLVENGSTDNSWNISKKLEKEFEFVKAYKLPSASYGLAIRHGIVNAIGQEIFLLNVDYYDILFIEKAVKLLKIVDIVIGSKTLVNSEDHRSFLRRTATYLFNVFLRLFLNYPGTDTHGIKGFRRSDKLINFSKNCKTQNELFDTELILRLVKSGKTFIDLPQSVFEIRSSRYLGSRRFFSTLYDFFSVFRFKYFSKNQFYSELIDADDFGLSTKVNLAILKEANSEAIDIVSIMPNLVKKKDLENIKNNSFVKHAMHFNLLRGKPCSNQKLVNTLIDREGNFYSLPIFIFRLFFGLIELEQIKIEFFSQYKELIKLGVTPDYLNSEQHLHIFSPINRILELEIKNTSIKKIRSLSSSFYSLEKNPFRIICLFFIKKILDLRFGKFLEFNKAYEAWIIHPGAK